MTWFPPLDNLDHATVPEPPRTRRGLLKIACNLFNGRPHGSHRYLRGDERVVCPGRPRD